MLRCARGMVTAVSVSGSGSHGEGGGGMSLLCTTKHKNISTD
jgi:hypothetical protein